jgi:hypothetical protein
LPGLEEARRQFNRGELPTGCLTQRSKLFAWYTAMGWRHKGNRSYYYRQHREGKRVVSTYLPGELGKAWSDAQKGEHRLRKLLKEFKRELVANDRPALELHRDVKRVADLMMVASGHHKPARHWRKIRDMSKLPAIKVNPPAPGAETTRMMDRAAKGDSSVYPEVVAFLDDPERGEAFVNGIGSMANLTRIKMVESLAGGDVLLEEAFHRRLEHIREMTAGPNPSPMEALLAETISINWLVLYRHRYHVANMKGQNIPYVEFHMKCAEQAHRQYMASILTLARVRKCALPNLLQFNIAQSGHQQVVNG